MLQLKSICKTYKTGNLIQTALDNVSLVFKDVGFVSILGPSGSGKTTLMNIIGGLDRYDSGDLIINNVSTKKYKDKDWDSYRNHTIGFIFQSYNLIPHQTVLKNVELALTISGIGAKERKQRALDALDKVGLLDQAHKRPNQMSGGQMQRVAIARALVGNPSILLADEPTGALDTKTSIQIMELLKEVAKDRLVIMVTHNPELAEQYSSRLIKLKDGKIVEDSKPARATTKKGEIVHKNLGHAKMSWFTALGLSFNNLLTKKGRTILTAFAGSIGIIGIALILALSDGMKTYIDKIQEDTLTSYPLSIQSETADLFSAVLGAKIEANGFEEEGKVKEAQMISSMMNSVGSNDLKGFKKYLEEHKEEWDPYVKDVTYSYSVSPLIYTYDVTGKYTQLNPSTLMSSLYNDSATSLMSSISASSSMGSFSERSFKNLDEDFEILQGRFPEKYDEVFIGLSNKNQIVDLLLYSLGLKDESELKKAVTDAMSGNDVSVEGEPLILSYDDLMNVDLRLIDATKLYKYNKDYDVYEDMRDNKDWMKDLYDSSLRLKIVGLAIPKGDNKQAGVFYSKELTSYVIENAKNTEIVKKQIENKDVDVFSGKSFDDNSKDTGLDFNDMVTVDEDILKNAFSFDLDISAVQNTDYTTMIMNSSDSVKKSIVEMAETFSTALTSTDIALAQGMIQGYTQAFSQTVYSQVNGCTGGDYAYPGMPAAGCVFTNPELVEGVDYAKLDVLGHEIYYSLIDGYSTTTYVSFADKIVNPLTGEEMDVFPYYINMFKSSGAITTASAKLAENKIVVPNENIEKIIFEIFNDYITFVKESEKYNTVTNTITLEDLNTLDYSSVITNVLENENNASMIYGDAYDNAEEYMSLLVAKGMGETTGEIMSPITKMFEGMEDAFRVDTDAFAKAFNFNMDEEELSRLMTSMLTGSNVSYSNNLVSLGYQDIEDPSVISIFFRDFASKTKFLEWLDSYNETVDEDSEIKYTDITGILISSVETIINAITYILIAFVSISLIVSSIMIAIITLISVMERTKEIGILRAMGASKKNVSSIFNAETFIIGLLSGSLAIGFSYAVIPIANNIIHQATDNYDINAILRPQYAIILIIISIVLTLVAGFIPSKKAAKQDPVIALRTE